MLKSPCAQFASGLSVNYGKSLLVAKEGDAAEQGDGTEVSSSSPHQDEAQSKPSLATNITIGMRIPSFKVLNQSDARPWHLHELLPSNGRWRILIFPGDILSSPTSHKRLLSLSEKLSSPTSFIRKFTPSPSSIPHSSSTSHSPLTSLIEPLLIHSTPRKSTTIFTFPPIFRPFSPTHGYDYTKIYVDDESYHEGHGHLYQNLGIDPSRGCAVVVRPDQYVAWVGEMDSDGYEAMEKFFGGFMKVQEEGRGCVGVGIEEEDFKEEEGVQLEKQKQKQDDGGGGGVGGLDGSVEGVGAM